jgi:hypothetical protein
MDISEHGVGERLAGELAALTGADEFRPPVVDWCTRHLTETVTED